MILDHRRREVDTLIMLTVVAARRRGRQGGWTVDITGHVLDRPGDGVLAVEGALGTAQHFDLLHVNHVEQRRLRPRQVHIVDVNADAGIKSPERVALSDAAYIGVDRATG